MPAPAFRGDLFVAENDDFKLKQSDVRCSFHRREDATYTLAITHLDKVLMQKLASGGDRMEFDPQSRSVLWARSECVCLMLRSEAEFELFHR